MAKEIDMSRARFWTEDKIVKASRLWNSGVVSEKIAAEFGVSRGSLSGIAAHYREHFPLRTKPKYTLPVSLKVEPAPILSVVPKPKRLKSFVGDRWVDRVPYTTISGAVVSLPRVSILNGKEA